MAVVTHSKQHDAAEDHRALLSIVKRHEDRARRVERERHAKNIAALCPPFVVVDPTGFGEDCVIDFSPYPAPIGGAA